MKTKKRGTTMNKIGVSFRINPETDMNEELRLLRSIGFDGVFTMFSGFQETEDYANAIRDAGLDYSSVHAPFKGINAIWQEGEEGEAMLQQLCDTVEGCRQFDIPVAVIHLSSGENAPCINDLGHSRWDRLVDCAVKNNVTLALENQRKLANIAFMFEVYDNVDQVRFCWDTGHEACFAGGREYMPLFGKKLAYTHIHDNFRRHGEDLHLIPFEGSIHFDRVAQLLKQYSYQGPLTLELKVNPNRTFEDQHRRAYAAATKLREMIEII